MTLVTLGQQTFVIRLLIGIALSALGAALLALSMPPYGIWPFALIGLVPTILAQYRVMPRQFSSLASAITIGGLVGLYIMNAFLQLGNVSWYIRLLPVIFGVIVFLTDLGTRAFHERTAYRWFVLAGALSWVGVEMIRSLIPVMGTWGFIACAYFKQPRMIQPVSVFGIFGLSLVTMLVGFALTHFHDQYGNSGTYVFATEDWIEIDLVPAGCFANTSGSCRRGIAAVAPGTPRILLRDGTLVHLPTMAHTNVLTTTGASSIVQAAWSPSEKYLAFTARDADRVPVLYVAGGSGEPVEEIVELNPEDRWADSVTVTWTPSEDGVTVETERNRYTVDVVTGRVEVVPIPEGGGAP